MSSDDGKIAMTPPARIGFIGLGVMGAPMAGPLAPLLEAGAVRMDSPRALGAASDIVLTSLPDPAISKRVVLGAEGLIEGLAAESTVIGMSTDGIETVREIQAALAARHIRFVDCPVGKGPTAAVAGELQLFAAGDRETCDSLRWLLSMIGSKIDYCGPIGAGQAIKLANNLLSCGYGALISEAYAMAKKAGADLNIFCEALPQTAANSWPLQNVFVAKAFKGDFTPYFRLSAAHKDYKLVIAMADALGTPSHAARAVLDYYTAAAAAGHGDRDFGAIALVNNPELLGD